MAVEPSLVESRIRAGVPGITHFTLEDLTGTKDHYQAVVVSSSFAALSKVEQHRAVYRALGELMDGPVHALALKTYTPEAWSALGAQEKR